MRCTEGLSSVCYKQLKLKLRLSYYTIGVFCKNDHAKINRTKIRSSEIILPSPVAIKKDESDILTTKINPKQQNFTSNLLQNVLKNVILTIMLFQLKGKIN